MGASMSWIAVKGCDREVALGELGFELKGQENTELDGRLNIATLPSGWLLFVAMRNLDVLFRPNFVALSRHGAAVGCAIEEHVMFMEARGFEDGAECWRVTHNSEDGLYDLKIGGQPPAALAAIRERLFAQQDKEGGEDAGVDFISDIPVDLANEICGFRHDEWPSDMRFTEVRKAHAVRAGASASGPGFLQRLFGRK